MQGKFAQNSPVLGKRTICIVAKAGDKYLHLGPLACAALNAIPVYAVIYHAAHLLFVLYLTRGAVLNDTTAA